MYLERYDYISHAIIREKQTKGWSRKKKEDLINMTNPAWKFMYNELKAEIPADDHFYQNSQTPVTLPRNKDVFIFWTYVPLALNRQLIPVAHGRSHPTRCQATGYGYAR